MEITPVTLPEGHHPGLCIATLCRRKNIRALEFAQCVDISEHLIKRLFAGKIGIHESVVHKIAGGCGYMLGIPLTVEELLRAQQAFHAFAARNKELSGLALRQALKSIELPEESNWEFRQKHPCPR